MINLKYLSGTTKLSGILGFPVSHSLSPRLHGYWLRKYSIDGIYIPLSVKKENFITVVRSLVNLGFRGANVTIPYKETVFSLCDKISERAKKIGAVNTLVFDNKGHIEGDNSDGFGFMENLKQNAPQWSASQGSTVILGAGGAARAIIASLLEAGSSEIHLCNRSQQRAEALAKLFGKSLKPCPWEKKDVVLAEAALLVNTTSLGMDGKEALDIDLSALPSTAIATDVVYTPLQTPLLKRAREKGCMTVDGLGMLLHQAKAGFSAWFGFEPEVDQELRDCVGSALKQRTL